MALFTLRWFFICRMDSNRVISQSVATAEAFTARFAQKARKMRVNS